MKERFPIEKLLLYFGIALNVYCIAQGLYRGRSGELDGEKGPANNP